MRTFILPAILCLLAQVLAYPLVPLAAAFSTPDGRLPRWAWWLETHDDLGWSGPLSVGFQATRWGMVRWLLRNKAYAFRDLFRATPTAEELAAAGTDMPPYPRLGPYLHRYAVGRWWEVDTGVSLIYFRLFVRIGWKIKPYTSGHRPVGVTATGILIPFAVRTDGIDPE